MHEFPLTWQHADGWTRSGTVTAIAAHSISVRAPGVAQGAVLFIDRAPMPPLVAQAVSVSGDNVTCALIGPADGVIAGTRATTRLASPGAFVGDSLLGAATDAWGRCANRVGAAITRLESFPLPVSARARVSRPLRTGVAAIDAFVTLGFGQRIALFAGAGVGKTTLLRRIVECAGVDARVVALIGERGREAAELIGNLRNGPMWQSTTVVYATAEAPPIERLAAARSATAHAEALAATGRDVLLVVDSLTRVATAWREIAMAGGEAPAHRGYPPSMGGMIARLVERAGARHRGTITGIYAVLVDGDDLREPVTDAVRALLDGHVVLARSIAEAGRFPAIDVLRSLSRQMDEISTPQHRQDAMAVRRAIAALERADDLFAIGAYRPGGDAYLDSAVAAREAIDALIFDEDGDASARRHPIAALAEIAARVRAGS